MSCRTNNSGHLASLRTSLIINLNCIILLLAVSFTTSCSSARYQTRGDTGSGVATWYGPEFHGKNTASGERFNMYDLTCAHKELPFGSVLEVTNTANGRSVKCTVNDRGPFVSGRDLDLSYAAAKEIGLIGPGQARVKITYLGRDTSYVKEVRYVSSGGPYTVQVGSFKELDNALHLKASLELKYKDVYIIEAKIKKTTHYRVRVGKFQRREEAFGLAKTLADEGYSPLVTHYEERA
ncbi:MAG TPA: septal ring lytic transglycosylase RlpA family protein [Thermodesulfovibrionales bacterium]|nr:septal ring lytic transglycosylase RlpA family protein [Thermodesulfovibrionales bacterium]